ncbi:MAG: TRAP transporter TatT component family protein [bacterium]
MLRRYLIGLLVVVSLITAQSSDSLIDNAIELFGTRHLNSGNLAVSAEILSNVIEQEPENVRALYELSRVYYLLGDEANTKKDKLELYETGKKHAKKAIKLDGNSKWAHFWYVVNVGRIGQTKGVLNSLASVPEINKELDKVLKLDPEHTGALDVKAMLYYELPGLLGGNLNKSLEALNKSIEIDSNYSLLYLDMGKVWIKKKDYANARWYLKRLLDIQEPTYMADFVLDDKPEALELLEEIKDR